MAYAGEIRINTGLETKDLQSELNNLVSTVTGHVNGIDLSIAGVSASIIALAKKAVDMGISFESAFTGVVKTVDATDAELAELRQGLLDLSNEIPVTANELAGIAESAGQLGIANEYILDFTEVMANLGVATNMTSEQAATDLARLANITQMSQTEFSNLGSSIVALGNNYATTESELTSMATRLAAAGAQANLSEADILGFSAAASSLGIEAEAGGTALSKVFTMIQTAVETGSESLNDYADVAGMTADAFVKAFQEDASGAITAFITGLGDVERTGKSATVILDELGITEVRLSNALKSLSGSGDLLTSAIEMSNTAWEENTALTIEAETRYGTMESKIQDLQNGLATLGITLYESVRDPIEAVVGVAGALIDGFNSLPDGLKETITQAVVLAGALGAAKTAMTTLNTAKAALAKLSAQSAKAIGEESAEVTKANIVTEESIRKEIELASVKKSISDADKSYKSALKELINAKDEAKLASDNLAKAEQDLKAIQSTESQNTYLATVRELTEAKGLQQATTEDLVAAELELKNIEDGISGGDYAAAYYAVEEAKKAQIAASSDLVNLETQYSDVLADLKGEDYAEVYTRLSTSKEQGALAVTEAHQKEALAATAVEAAEKKVAATSAEVTSAQAAQTAMTKAATAADKESAIATTTDTAAKKLNIAAIKEQAKAQAAAMLSSPMFWTTASVMAVSALTSAVEYLNGAYDRQVDKVKKLVQEQESLQSEIDTLNGELETTKARIEEINAQDTISLVDEQELENLQLTNKELETQIAYLERKAELAKQETEDESLDTLKGKIDVVGYAIDELGREYETVTKMTMADATVTLIARMDELKVAEAGLVEEMYQYALAGDTTSAAYQALGIGLENTRQKMRDTEDAIIDIAGNYTTLTGSISETTKGTQEFKDAVGTMPEDLENYIGAVVDVTGDLTENLGLLADAYANGKIATADYADTLIELMANIDGVDISSGELADKLAELEASYANGTMTAGDYIAAIIEMVLSCSDAATAAEKAAAATTASEKAYTDAKTSVDELAESYEEGDLSASEYKKALEALKAEVNANAKENPELADTYEEIAKMLDGELTDSTLIYLSAMEEARDKASDLSSEIDILSGAFDENGDAVALSTDEVFKFIDAGYLSALQVNEETGEITLNAEAAHIMAAAKIEAAKADLILAKTDLESAIRAQKVEIDEITDSTGVLKAEKLQLVGVLEAEKNGVEAGIAAIDQLTSALDKVGTAYKSGGSGGGGSSAASKAKEETEKVSEAIQEELDYLDLLQERGEITYKELVMHLNNMLNTYELNATEREKIDEKYEKAYTKLLQERQDAEEDVIEALEKKIEETYANTYSEAVSWIEKRVKSGEMGINEEIAAYEKLMNAYAEGTDEYASSLEALEAAQDSLIERQLEIADSLEDLDQEYQDFLTSRQDALYSTWGLFDEVAKAEEVSKEELKKNLQDQLTALTEWRNNIQKLASRGILSDAFISELEQMGPEAAAQIKALTTMSTAELQAYHDAWAEKNDLVVSITADEVATKEAKKTIDAQIDDLQAEMDALDDSTNFVLTIETEEALNSIFEFKNQLDLLAGTGDSEEMMAAYEELQNASLEKARQEYKALLNEIENANAELERVNSRIVELENLDTPTLADEQELEKLKSTNTELENQIKLLQQCATEAEALTVAGSDASVAALATALGLDASTIDSSESLINALLADDESIFGSMAKSIYSGVDIFSTALDEMYTTLEESDYNLLAAVGLDSESISGVLDSTNETVVGYIGPMTDAFEGTYTSVYDAVDKLNEEMYNQTMTNLLNFMNDLIATMQAKVDELRALANEAASLGGYVSSGSSSSGGSASSGEGTVINMPITYNASEQSTEMDAQVLGETIAGYVKSALAGKGVR